MPHELKIFRSGKHTTASGQEVTFSDEDLQKLVDSYDPKKHQAPIVLGHPDDDAPAYGWIKGMSIRNGEVFAETEQVHPDLIDAVDSGLYRHLSASFYAPNSTSNPTPGNFHLRHVGILGAQPPAIKGLGAVKFSEEDKSTILSFNFQEVKKMPDEKKPDPVTTPAKAETITVDPQAEAFAKYRLEFAEQAETARKAMDAQAAKLKERESALAAKEAEIANLENLAFAEKMISEGRLLPPMKAKVAAILSGMSGDSTVEFSESDGKKTTATAKTLLKELFSSLPVQVSFGETKQYADIAPTATTGYNAPRGFTVDPASAALHAEIMAFSEANKVDYITAVGAVTRTKGAN